MHTIMLKVDTSCPGKRLSATQLLRDPSIEPSWKNMVIDVISRCFTVLFLTVFEKGCIELLWGVSSHDMKRLQKMNGVSNQLCIKI